MRSFKNNIKTGSYICIALLLTMIGACKKDGSIGDLGAAPTPDMVKFTATPTSANANIITFTSQSPGFKAIWDFGNGGTAEGTTVTGSFPIAGTYNVTLRIVTDGGYTEASKTITIASTNPAMLSDPAFTLISGGLADADGVTWMVDKTQPGHLGVGDLTQPIPAPTWWSAGPNEKAAEGIYDDEMTFNMNGLKYTYDNHGDTFANGSNSAALGGPGTSDDITLPYTPPNNMTWIITESGGKKFLTISGGGFLAYYTGVSQYEILTLTADEMYLKFNDASAAGTGWWMKLIRKGYTRPVVPKPLKPADLSDDFDVTSNFTWTAENMTFKRSYDNPFALPPNPSVKVGYYEKWNNADGQYGNLQVTLPYRFDLTTTNKIKLKVYMPGGNNFPAVNPTVSVKLQNSLLGGDSWTTQKEIKLTVSPTEYNKWVELEFDFSAFASETVYDKIVVQLGGEGHPNPGIFYIDDFEFK